MTLCDQRENISPPGVRSRPSLGPTLTGVRGHSVSALGGLGRIWEWAEDNLGMRAATAVTKMVEKGRVVGLDGTLGAL